MVMSKFVLEMVIKFLLPILVNFFSSHLPQIFSSIMSFMFHKFHNLFFLSINLLKIIVSSLNFIPFISDKPRRAQRVPIKNPRYA